MKCDSCEHLELLLRRQIAEWEVSGYWQRVDAAETLKRLLARVEARKAGVGEANATSG